MHSTPRTAKRWFISGRVQGVGYRYFAQREAVKLGLNGYARNLDDGRVEVYATGPAEALSSFSARLREGARYADVRGVEEREAALEGGSSFEIG
jgi:acylphosphatase